MWERELGPWLPPAIFDAHVHLGPPGIVRPFSPERQKLALSTFASLTWEQYALWHARLFGGRQLAGLIAFPFPMVEVDLEAANGYMVQVMKAAPQVKGFLVSHPTDVRPTIGTFEAALAQGVRFAGVKPYFDLVGKSVFDCTMPEFIPEALWKWLDRQRLAMMLHTSGHGMGDAGNQAYLRRILEQYPRVRVILAHMGRYVRHTEFFAFADSGLLDYPNLYLETSSATVAEVYRRALAYPGVAGRLVFGSDLPFGLISGVEAWSDTHGAIFVTRDPYRWNDPGLAAASGVDPGQLTYNTYHTIRAVKQAISSLDLPGPQTEALKQKVFFDNAAALFGRAEE
jgi:hypothetical protein